MWELISRVGRVSRTLVWDREAAIGGSGKVTPEAAAFAGTLGVRIRLAPPRDPEFKGLIERRNGFFETSFLPGRVFTSRWTSTSSRRLAASARTCARAVDRRPPGGPRETDGRDGARRRWSRRSGCTHGSGSARDYYVRIDGNDYSVDPERSAGSST